MRTRPVPPRMKIGRAAEYLGVSRRHLHDMLKLGAIPYYRFGPRVIVLDRTDLDQFLADRKVG